MEEVLPEMSRHEMDYLSVTPLFAAEDENERCPHEEPCGPLKGRLPCQLPKGHAGPHAVDAAIVPLLVARINGLLDERKK